VGHTWGQLTWVCSLMHTEPRRQAVVPRHNLILRGAEPSVVGTAPVAEHRSADLRLAIPPVPVACSMRSLSSSLRLCSAGIIAGFAPLGAGSLGGVVAGSGLNICQDWSTKIAGLENLFCVITPQE
jgi:hypothetical protein